MSAPPEIVDLVERFEQHAESYRSGFYNEAQLRKEFVDPMFKALGWDMENVSGYAEAYKDVIHEDAIKIGGATKAPDYCFRIGGTRKFFLEAKKPSLDIKTDAASAYQLRRYAWSAKLPLSVLTDFEEFAAYDCRVEPKLSDNAAAARVLYLTFGEYASRWSDIAGIFAREAILKGSFDRFAESTKAKRGTAEVDDAFLSEIDQWRSDLARNLALRNPKLTQRDLNFAVQRTIDRIVFLRICEDRRIETYGRLQALLNGENTYRRLYRLFREADERYNSGLFYFQKEKDRVEPPDDLTPELEIDDAVLKRIIRRLYYPDSPYEFSVLPADILGQVYEQFLGKVIRLTEGHQARIEDKSEVKKAGGVYYTPTYVVDYIVKTTVGKLLENKTPGQAAKLRIVDPACGSGSFLIAAYQYLLNWHRDWYVDHDPQKSATGRDPALYRGMAGEWKLTTGERKRILLQNIFGVDIDAQAVEVTKLSLLLKVLEGESEETLATQLRFLHERALPDLGSNIKCGNSLIAPDFYHQQELDFLDEEERYRINVFDWNAEFPDIMKGGGFDAVIGNPPWGASFSEPELEYLRRKNQAMIVRMIDSFMYFVHQTSQHLQKGGCFGMILPDVLLYQIDNKKLREYIVTNFTIRRVVNMGDVFHKVTRPACIIVFDRRPPTLQNPIEVADLSKYKKVDKPLQLQKSSNFISLFQREIKDVPGVVFATSSLGPYSIWRKVRAVPNDPLERLVDNDGIQRGVSPDLKEAFLVDAKTARKAHLESEKLRKVLTGGKQVRRYYINRPDLLLIYTGRTDNFRELPNICSFIDQFRSRITCKEVKQKKHSIYSLHRARDEQIFLKPEKFLGVITEDEIIVALDDQQTFATDGLYLFALRGSSESKYVLGILNSKLFVFIYRLLAIETGRVLAQVKPTVLAQLPIRRIDMSVAAEKDRHDRMVSLVERMLELHKQLPGAKTAHEQTTLQRQIDAIDAQIDQLVYELYGLSEDEIKIVERSGV